MRTGPILTPAEQGSTCWQKLEAVLNERLATHRRYLESPSTPSAKREELVWRISELKEFLKLGSPASDKKANAG